MDPSFEGLDNDNSVDHESDNSEGYWERAKNSKCPCLYIQVQLCKESLKDILKSSNRKDSLHIFDQILDGIIYMHDRQIVHMDLTPDNIFVDKEGSIRIGDFGLGTLHRNLWFIYIYNSTEISAFVVHSCVL